MTLSEQQVHTLIHAVFGQLSLSDLEKLIEQEKNCWYAAMHYGNSGQIEEQRKFAQIVREIRPFSIRQIADHVERAFKEYEHER